MGSEWNILSKRLQNDKEKIKTNINKQEMNNEHGKTTET